MLALLLVYMVRASQYESYVDPLIVMFSTPFAATGVLVTLFLTDTTLNLQSGIGCIMLGGIVVNNAILLVDQANQFRRNGLPIIEALKETGTRRLRPVLMTTLTTILALLALALGVGRRFRCPGTHGQGCSGWISRIYVGHAGANSGNILIRAQGPGPKSSVSARISR